MCAWKSESMNFEVFNLVRKHAPSWCVCVGKMHELLWLTNAYHEYEKGNFPNIKIQISVDCRVEYSSSLSVSWVFLL